MKVFYLCNIVVNLAVAMLHVLLTTPDAASFFHDNDLISQVTIHHLYNRELSNTADDNRGD